MEQQASQANGHAQQELAHVRTRSGRPKPTPVDVHAPHAGAMDATPPHIPTEIKPKALASFGSGRHTSFIGPADDEHHNPHDPVTAVYIPPSAVDRHDATHVGVAGRLPGDQSREMNAKWQALTNSWMALAMVAFIVIICVSSTRTHEPEPGQSWHAITQLAPFAQELEGDPVYVQAEVQLPPWDTQELGSQGVLLSPAHQGNRRSMRADAFATLRQLMASSTAGSGAPLPALEAFVGQQLNVSSGNLSWTPLTWFKYCTYKEGQSQSCLIDFRNIVRLDQSLPAAMVVRIQGNTTFEAVSAMVHVVQMGGFGLVKEWIALLIIGLVLIALALEVMHRMWIAFVGAFLMTGLLLLANLAPDLPKVISWIDPGTMGLLFGMMIIVGQLQGTGVFEVICAWGLQKSRGNLLLLTILLCLLTAFVSAWLDNVTTMLLMAPMTISVFKVLERDPRPLLITQAMLSNVGGTATQVGDPPNIIIGNVLRQYIGFVDFIINLAPGVLMVVIPTLAVLVALYRKHLTGKVSNMDTVVELVSKYRITNWRLFWMCTYVTLGVIIAFLLQPIHHLNPGWVALIGATILVIAAAPHDASAVLHAVEWDMLLFFAGMFIMVEGAVELGLMRRIASFILMIIDTAPVSAQEIAAIECILWFSAIFSAVLDNIPYTIAMLPVIQQMADESPQLSLTVLAWALAFGACLGGNGTLIGASANIVTSGVAGREGYHISFFSWLYAGVPTLLVSVAVANVYMLLRYCT